ncbi:MAG: D-threo-aldose 1-dehydrogenase, partial [Gaiellales bacterium]|nr:D-threo-aldose 1-dehydrogenase [Gaiellales bacterium]
IAYIHDPDEHWEEALGGAWPALRQLRDEGVVKAIGVGIKQVPMLVRFARETDMDVFMVAGRYTLLDPSAIWELLPLCEEKGIAVVVAGVMNSGILADPRPGGRFDYLPAPPDVVDSVRRMSATCARYGIPLRAAAVQFPLAHPAVRSVIAGVRRIEQLEEYPELLRAPIPADLWADLRAEGLIDPSAPVPDAAPVSAAAVPDRAASRDGDAP